MKALTIASVAVLGLYCLLLTMLALATHTPGVCQSACVERFAADLH